MRFGYNFKFCKIQSVRLCKTTKQATLSMPPVRLLNDVFFPAQNELLTFIRTVID